MPLQEDQSKLVLFHWSSAREKKIIGLYVNRRAAGSNEVDSQQDTLHQLNTFHPKHFTKELPLFTESWGEHTQCNSLGYQTGICLRCLLQAFAKQMKVLSVCVPCWWGGRKVYMNMLGQHQAQLSRESLSAWLCRLMDGTTSSNVVPSFKSKMYRCATVRNDQKRYLQAWL